MVMRPNLTFKKGFIHDLILICYKAADIGSKLNPS